MKQITKKVATQRADTAIYPEQELMYRDKQVLIIGGTSGIGLGLAKYYLLQGAVVTVCGRDKTKLSPALLTDFPLLTYCELDVRNVGVLMELFTRYQHMPLDLMIYSAGFYFNERRSRLNKTDSDNMLETNFEGFISCFRLSADLMRKQKHGQIVTIASVAGLLNSVDASLYSQLKAAMIQTALGYRKALSPYQVEVTTLVPGYINTDKLRQLNNGDASHKPFLLSVDQAVACMTAAIARKQRLCIFPRRMKYLVNLLNCLPTRLVTLILNQRH